MCAAQTATTTGDATATIETKMRARSSAVTTTNRSTGTATKMAGYSDPTASATAKPDHAAVNRAAPRLGAGVRAAANTAAGARAESAWPEKTFIDARTPLPRTRPTVARSAMTT